MKPQSFFLAAFASFCCAAILFAQTTDAPHKINFQGKLNNPTQGPVNLTLSIYKTAIGGTALWSETQNNVTVLNGIFNVILGSATPIPNAVFKNGGDLFLEIRVGNTPLSKRVQIASVAYAIKATLADTAKVALSVGSRNSLDAADGDPKDAVLVDNDGVVNIGKTSTGLSLFIGGSVKTEASSGNVDLTIKSSSKGNADLTAQCSADDITKNAHVYLGNTDFGTGDGFVIYWEQSTDKFHIADFGGANRLSIDTNGNVGIGTSSPTAKLHLGGAPGVDGILFPDGTLQTTAGVFSLPYLGVSDKNSTLFSITSTGLGEAGQFEITNVSNNTTALNIATAGLGDGGTFEIKNENNESAAIVAATSGKGNAGFFEIKSLASNSAAVYATTKGPGPALQGVATVSGHAGEFNGRVYIDGDVGIRTDEPAGILDVAIPAFGFVRLGQNAIVSEVQFTNGRIRSEVAKFQILGQDLAGDAVPITFGQVANDIDVMIATDGNVGVGTTNPTEKLFVQGNIRATGSITPGSSREFKENIAALSLQEATTTLAALNPVKFNYKTDEPKDLHVGFIAEEVPELLATPDRKGVDPMDVIAVLAKVVQDQQKELAALREEVNALKRQKR